MVADEQRVGNRDGSDAPERKLLGDQTVRTKYRLWPALDGRDEHLRSTALPSVGRAQAVAATGGIHDYLVTPYLASVCVDLSKRHTTTRKTGKDLTERGVARRSK